MSKSVRHLVFGALVVLMGIFAMRSVGVAHAATTAATPLAVSPFPLCGEQPNHKNCDGQRWEQQACTGDRIEATKDIYPFSNASGGGGGRAIARLELHYSTSCRSNWAVLVPNYCEAGEAMAVVLYANATAIYAEHGVGCQKMTTRIYYAPTEPVAAYAHIIIGSGTLKGWFTESIRQNGFQRAVSGF